MILAYLRNPDFIKPDYPHGKKSRLREELFIKAAALQESRDLNIVHLDSLRTYFSSAVSKDAKTELLDSIYNTVSIIEGTYSFEFGTPRHKRLENSRTKMVKAFEILMKKGLVGPSDGFTPEKVREIISEHRKKLNKPNV